MSQAHSRFFAAILLLSTAGVAPALGGCADDAETEAFATASNASGSGGGSPGSSGSSTAGSGAAGSGAAGSGAAGSGAAGSGAAGSGASGSGGAGNGGGGGGGGGVVRFAAMGDTGKANQGQNDVAAAVATKCMIDGCDFVQLLGDNIYDSGVDSTSDPQWQTKFEQPYAAIDLPFWAVLGNHDYGGNGQGNEFAKGQNEIDYSNVSTKWKMPAAYHQRSVAHVDFFTLDTNMAMYLQAAQQKTDVAGWLAASTATWKIALGHHPYLSNGPHGNAGAYDGLPFVPIVNGAGVKELLDGAVCGKADVYFCGHDHSIQLLTPACGGSTALVVAGAGSSPTELPGSNATLYQTLDIGFVYVRIEDNVMTIEVVGAAGDVGFTHTITK